MSAIARQEVDFGVFRATADPETDRLFEAKQGDPIVTEAKRRETTEEISRRAEAIQRDTREAV